jgi:hypothetical protein
VVSVAECIGCHLNNSPGSRRIENEVIGKSAPSSTIICSGPGPGTFHMPLFWDSESNRAPHVAPHANFLRENIPFTRANKTYPPRKTQLVSLMRSFEKSLSPAEHNHNPLSEQPGCLANVRVLLGGFIFRIEPTACDISQHPPL